jgi:hypothetical protein
MTDFVTSAARGPESLEPQTKTSGLVPMSPMPVSMGFNFNTAGSSGADIVAKLNAQLVQVKMPAGSFDTILITSKICWISQS